jgi:hypothetical protein
MPPCGPLQPVAHGVGVVDEEARRPPRLTVRPLKIHGSASAPRPTIATRAPVSRRMRASAACVAIPPLPQTGIETAATARSMRVQSTSAQ